jgi:hypothetical protein
VGEGADHELPYSIPVDIRTGHTTVIAALKNENNQTTLSSDFPLLIGLFDGASWSTDQSSSSGGGFCRRSEICIQSNREWNEDMGAKTRGGDVGVQYQ